MLNYFTDEVKATFIHLLQGYKKEFYNIEAQLNIRLITTLQTVKKSI